MAQTDVLRTETRAMARELKDNARSMALIVGALWVLELVDTVLLGQALNNLGIHPRDFALSGALGILLAPLLHGGLGHLLANTLSGVVLGGLVMLKSRAEFWAVTAASWLVGGLGIWMFGGSGTVHVGASTIIYGYLGYLMLWGWYRRSWAAILGSLATVFAFGGLIWGLFPVLAGAGISWEGHLFGFLGGALAARTLGSAKRTKAERKR